MKAPREFLSLACFLEEEGMNNFQTTALETAPETVLEPAPELTPEPQHLKKHHFAVGERS